MFRYRTHRMPKTSFELFQCSLLSVLAIVIFFHDLYLLTEMTRTFSFKVCFVFGTLLVFAAVNVVGNFIYFISIDTSILTFVSFNDIQSEWRTCPMCELQVPPRSFHCNVCNICILKRDHHCIFTGCCSGYFNHRYYIALVTHLWCAAALSLFFNCSSKTIWPVVVANGWWSVAYSICPVVFWLTGFTESRTFFIFLMSAITLYGLFFVTGLLAYHWQLIVKGQTAFENSKNVKTYVQTWKENVTEVLGLRWLAVMLWFGVSSPLPGNGQTFSVAAKVQ